MCIDKKDKFRVEGYYATSVRDKKKKSPYPFPKRHDTPWEGEASFLEKLHSIQQSAIEGDYDDYTGIMKIQFLGWSMDRFEPTRKNGDVEYQDHVNKVKWPEGFAYYVKTYHVQPSKEFYDYVVQYVIQKDLQKPTKTKTDRFIEEMESDLAKDKLIPPEFIIEKPITVIRRKIDEAMKGFISYESVPEPKGRKERVSVTRTYTLSCCPRAIGWNEEEIVKRVEGYLDELVAASLASPEIFYAQRHTLKAEITICDDEACSHSIGVGSDGWNPHQLVGRAK